jgi:hypothetical protein
LLGVLGRFVAVFGVATTASFCEVAASHPVEVTVLFFFFHEPLDFSQQLLFFLFKLFPILLQFFFLFLQTALRMFSRFFVLLRYLLATLLNIFVMLRLSIFMLVSEKHWNFGLHLAQRSLRQFEYETLLFFKFEGIYDIKIVSKDEVRRIVELFESYGIFALFVVLLNGS